MPVTGDTLRLQKLAAAAGQAVSSLKDAAGNTGPNINMSDFAIDGVTTPTWNIAGVSFGGQFTASANFVNPGPRFDRLITRDPNYVWGSTPSDTTLILTQGYLRTFRNDFNPGGTGCQSSTTRTVTVTYNDDFNDHASNFNTALTTDTITLFSPPAPSVAVTGSTRPPQPCDTGGGCGANCRGGTITVNGQPGTWQGVNGGTVSYYINNNFAGTNGGGQFTFTGLCGNFSYNIYVQNSFGCQSNTINPTVPAYI